MIRAWRHPAADAGPAQRSLLLPFLPSDLAEPELAADQVLVRVEAGVVGTAELYDRVDCTPGGAAVGTVQDTGRDATHLAGKRVLVGPDQGCGECDICRRAGVVVCPAGPRLGRDADGTLATAVVARARWVCALDGALSSDLPGISGPAAALIAREAAWAYAMFARAGVAPGEPVVIVGTGVVARFVCQIAAAKGVRPMLIQPEPGFAAWLEAAGGVPVHVQASDAAAVRAATETAAERGGHGKRPWYIFETSATGAGRALAMHLAGPEAHVIALATHVPARAAGPSEHDSLAAMLALDATIHGVAGAHPDLLPEVAALVMRGELDVAGAAHIVPIETLDPGAAQAVERSAPPTALVATMPDGPG